MSRILVIDDEEEIRDILRLTLEDAGFEVAVAENGRTGLESLVEEPAAVVVTDIVMPEQEGLETIGTIRRDFPNVKIIAMSGGGYSDPESYLDMARRLGARWAFAKPLDMEAFLEAVRESAAAADRPASDIQNVDPE